MEVIDIEALGDRQHALGGCRGDAGLDVPVPVVGCLGRVKRRRGGLAASPSGTTGAFGPVCFARALASTIDETGPDMLLRVGLISGSADPSGSEGRNHQGVDSDLRRRSGAHVSIRPSELDSRVRRGYKVIRVRTGGSY